MPELKTVVGSLTRNLKISGSNPVDSSDVEIQLPILTTVNYDSRVAPTEYTLVDCESKLNSWNFC